MTVIPYFIRTRPVVIPGIWIIVWLFMAVLKVLSARRWGKLGGLDIAVLVRYKPRQHRADVQILIIQIHGVRRLQA